MNDERERMREENRRRFPEVSAFVDRLREVFGGDQVKVLWAQENGYEVGQKPRGIDAGN
jgi:hypothetical protein